MVQHVTDWGYKCIAVPAPRINPFYNYPKASCETLAQYKNIEIRKELKRNLSGSKSFLVVVV
jgi:hypothetical protein